MSVEEFRLAAGDRLRPDDTLELSAFRHPYRLVYDCCDPPLVVIDHPDHPTETMFTSPRRAVSFTVLHSYLTAEAAVAEAERIYVALTAADYRGRGPRFRVFGRRGETAPLVNGEAAVAALRNAGDDRHFRISAYGLEHTDGRVATADLVEGAAPLFEPARRFGLNLFFSDKLDLSMPP